MPGASAAALGGRVVALVPRLSLAHPAFFLHSLATASHWPTEGGKGATFVSLNGGLMQAYMDRYGVAHDDFAPFALTAHANAQTSPHAVFKNKPLDLATYAAADTIDGPVQVWGWGCGVRVWGGGGVGVKGLGIKIESGSVVLRALQNEKRRESARETARDFGRVRAYGAFNVACCCDSSLTAALDLAPARQLFDASPTCDGAAAVVLTSSASVARHHDGQLLELLSSAAAIGAFVHRCVAAWSGPFSCADRLQDGTSRLQDGTVRHGAQPSTALLCSGLDRLPVAEREDVLHLRAVEKSAKKVRDKANGRG